MLILIGHLMMHHSDTRYKHLVDVFKTLQANISGLAPFFYLATLSPRQLQLPVAKPADPTDRSRSSRFAERMLTLFNYKTTLFDCFDQFTRIFFAVTGNLAGDSELRGNLMELYQQIFRGLREVQKLKLNAQRDDEELSTIPGGLPVSLIQSGKNLRATILAMMQSAFFTLHELASRRSSLTQIYQSEAGSLAGGNSTQHLAQAQLESKLVANLSKVFRQHISCMIDYTLDSYQLDRLKVTREAQAAAPQRKASAPVIANDVTARDMSAATRQILFASNTLFWVGVACLEAP